MLGLIQKFYNHSLSATAAMVAMPATIITMTTRFMLRLCPLVIASIGMQACVTDPAMVNEPTSASSNQTINSGSSTGVTTTPDQAKPEQAKSKQASVYSTENVKNSREYSNSSYAIQQNYPSFVMPRDMPLTEDAGDRQEFDAGQQVSYTTIASFAELRHIYKVRLGKYGWYEQTEQTQQTDEFLFMWFAHPNRPNVLHLRAVNLADSREGQIRRTMLRMD